MPESSVGAADDPVAGFAGSNYPGGYASEGPAWFGKGFGDHGICADYAIVADPDGPVNLAPGAKIDIVADAWRMEMDFILWDKFRRSADMGSHMYPAILADACGRIDHQQTVVYDCDTGSKDIGPETEAEPHRQALEPQQYRCPEEQWCARIEQILVKPHQPRQPGNRVK